LPNTVLFAISTCSISNNSFIVLYVLPVITGAVAAAVVAVTVVIGVADVLKYIPILFNVAILEGSIEASVVAKFITPFNAALVPLVNVDFINTSVSNNAFNSAKVLYVCLALAAAAVYAARFSFSFFFLASSLAASAFSMSAASDAAFSADINDVSCTRFLCIVLLEALGSWLVLTIFFAAHTLYGTVSFVYCNLLSVVIFPASFFLTEGIYVTLELDSNNFLCTFIRLLFK